MAIMCSGYAFEAWEAQCIRQALELDFVEPVLLIRDARSCSRPSLIEKFISYPYSSFLYRFYKRFFLKAASMKTIDLEKELSHIPVIDCSPVTKGKFSEYFSKEEIEAIRSHKPDLILRFGFNIVKGEILECATYGVWSFHHSDEQKYRGGPAGWWEIWNNDDVTGAILQRINDKLDAGIILKKGWFRTIKKSYSANVDQVFFGSSEWVKQVCIDIRNGTAGYFNAAPTITTAPVYKYPLNWQFLVACFKKLRHTLIFHWEELFRAEKWNVAIVNQPIEDLALNGITSPPRWLPPCQGDGYFADPFGYSDGERSEIMLERYDYHLQRADIAAYAENRVIPAIAEDYHLSYPFILHHGNDIYCIPETFENRTVNLYRLNRETKKWEFQKYIIEGIDAVDSTLVFHDGKWWLFCTLQEQGPNTKLFVYYSENFDGPYIPHLNNPVKTDTRSARPAGTPFSSNGRLYRPSQDCSSTYGAKVVISEITRLDEAAFEEKEVNTISPLQNSRFNKGLHTMSALGNVTLIDGKTFVFSYPHFRNALRRKLKKVI
jgi:hypothetical protein